MTNMSDVPNPTSNCELKPRYKLCTTVILHNLTKSHYLTDHTNLKLKLSEELIIASLSSKESEKMFDTTKKKLSGNKNNPNGKQILIVALHFFAESVKWRYLAGFKSLCIVFRCKVSWHGETQWSSFEPCSHLPLYKISLNLKQSLLCLQLICCWQICKSFQLLILMQL